MPDRRFYNPTHTHGGSFSGVIFLKVPPQITANSFDGQLCFHGPEDWHIQSFRTGMAHYVLPVPGEFYVFQAWQPHSVMPFRGDGERWSLAFNVVAAPVFRPQRCSSQPPSNNPWATSHSRVSDPRPKVSEKNCQSRPIASVQDSWVTPNRSSRPKRSHRRWNSCLLYTSDAADD